MIFSNTRGKAVNRHSLHRSLAAALRAAVLPSGITFHQLRHTYASLLIDGGESVTVVADRMGHKNATETLHTYSHLWPSSNDKTRRGARDGFLRGPLAPSGTSLTVDGQRGALSTWLFSVRYDLLRYTSRRCATSTTVTVCCSSLIR